MTAANPIITIDTNNPDPTKAINAFLWCMNKALELGMVPPTEHTLAAHLFRKSAGVVFYSSAGGVTSIVLDNEQVGDELDDEMLDMAVQIIRRRRKAKRDAPITPIEGTSHAD